MRRPAAHRRIAISELASVYTPAAWRALEHFPVDADTVELVEHSENVTYRVRKRQGDPGYVLRFHRPGYNSIDELNAERAWIRALAASRIPVPQPLPANDGAQFVRIDIPGIDETQYAGMTSWIEGEPLGELLASESANAERERIFFGIGELIAATHNQSASWQVPPGFTRPMLDADGLLGNAPRWGRFWEHAALSGAEKELLLNTRSALRATLKTYGNTRKNFGLIHADLDPNNIIYEGGKLALIDFDDSAFGWHLYDIASALIEYCTAQDLDMLRDALLAGYRAHRPLEARDLEMLPAFLLIRGMATIGWYHERPEHAGSAAFETVKNWTLEQCASFRL